MRPNLYQKIDRDIAAQLKMLGIGEKRSQKHTFPCITISREFGCEGTPLARHLVQKLSTVDYPWVMFHKELITEISEDEELQQDLADSVGEENRGKIHQYIEHLLAHKPTNVALYRKLAETLRILGERGRSVILGSGAAIINADLPNMLNVRLQAPLEFRIKRVSNILGTSHSESREKIRSMDNQREEFVQEFTNKDVSDPHHYHLVIDNSLYDAGQMTELIYHALVLRKMLPQLTA
ncbi:MAG: cytidylate kinase-like family protein [Cyclonatronaceae bacterium]